MSTSLLALLVLACGTDASKDDSGPLTTLDPTCDGDPAEVTLDRTPTWDDVAPILGASCTGCHVTGGAAPFALDTYAEASALATSIAASTQARTMPPWGPAPCDSCQPFARDPSLTDVELAVLQAWADAGAPQGDNDAAAPLAVQPTLDRTDVTVAGAEPYTPPEGVPDMYRCIVFDAPTDTAAFLTGYEVHPDNAAMLHHVVLAAVSDAATEAEVDALDAADPGPGWTCYATGTDGLETLFAWAPGQGAVSFPDGTGLPLRAGRRLVAQMHYNTRGGVGPDQTSVGLRLASSVPTPALMAHLSNNDLVLPPGQESVEATYAQTLPAELEGIRVWGLMPHMHQAGAAFSLTAERAATPDAPTCLMEVPRWDFNWQGFYLYETPVTLHAGDTLRMTCDYDTRGRSETTRFGEGTEDEMCMAFVYVSR